MGFGFFSSSSHPIPCAPCIIVIPFPVSIMPEIPSPPGVPILGNIFDVDPNETWNSLNKLAAQYGEWPKRKGASFDSH